MRSVFGLEEGKEQAATRRAVPDAAISSSSQSSDSQVGDCHKEDEVGRSGRQPRGLRWQAEVPSRGSRGAAGRALLALLLLGLCGQTLQQVDPTWCRDQVKDLDNPKAQLCADPSMGPRGGGTLVEVKGFLSVANFKSSCRIATWRCQFGIFFTEGSATPAQCDGGIVLCPSPRVPESKFQFVYVTGTFNNSGVVTKEVWPSHDKETLLFSYFGIHFIAPISGIVDFSPKVEIILLNAAEITSFFCRFIAYGPGWDQNALALLPNTIHMVDNFDGQIKNVTYRIPTDDPASLVRTSRILCGIPDSKLVLSSSASSAQLWVEVAETLSLSGVDRKVFTHDQKIFEIFRPPNVTGASLQASPYDGGTTVYVYGTGFRTYLGLSCQSLWCLDYDEPAGIATCKTRTFASAMFINSTTVRCTTGPYFAADAECNELCGPGGPDAPYRRIDAKSNLFLRKQLWIDCCGETCCSETTRLQVALNGVDYIPTEIVRGVPTYTMLKFAPKIWFTMYAVPKLFSVAPKAGPLRMGTTLTIIGNNLYPANETFSQNFTLCRFGVMQPGASSLTFVTTVATIVTPQSVSCKTPASIEPVTTLLGLSFNGQIFQTAKNVEFSYFKIDKLSPFFGGFFGGTLMRVSGPNIDRNEGVPGRKYECRFQQMGVNATEFIVNGSNTTKIMPATFSGTGALVCYTPPFMLGPAKVSISLADSFFSEQEVFYNFVDESVITTANPSVGPLTGGFRVVIEGINFINSTLLACRFKSVGSNIVVSGSNAQFISNTSVSCIAPVTTVSGPTQIYVLNNGQQDSPTFAPFIYFNVINVMPDGGVVEGGADVEVTLTTSFPRAWCRFGAAGEIVEGLLVKNGEVVPPYTGKPYEQVWCNETAVPLDVAKFSNYIVLWTNATHMGVALGNASYVYVPEAKPTWIEGMWVNGTWVEQGPWINGSWVNGTWVEGYWVNGTNGSWVNDSWVEAHWKDGVNGTWELVWQGGYWQNVTSGACSDTYQESGCVNGVFTDVTNLLCNGTALNSNCANGVIVNGTLLTCSGTLTGSYCNNGTWTNGSFVNGTWTSGWQAGTWVEGHYNQTWLPGTWIPGYYVNQTWQNGTWGPGYYVNQTWVNGSWHTIDMPLPAGCYRRMMPAPPPTLSNQIRCRTTSTMTPSIGGGKVQFAVSLNNRDFAVSPEFESFTFYPSPIIDTLLPQSGPLRGGTGITAIGNNFFTLCKTGTDPLTGECYRCNQLAANLFVWNNASSCKVTIPTVAPDPCGLPCRPGKDDRSAFGVTGQIYCRFGQIKMVARFMTGGRMKCVAPRTTNESEVTQVPMEISFNDQQFTNDQVLYYYYTITGMSPISGPTYGDTIISIKGHNLFSGARNGKEIQCLFWLDIFMLAAYDPINDVVRCAVPEQPAEMRDNGETQIPVKVTLNYRIADQFTRAELHFNYFEEPMALSAEPLFGPMSGGMEMELKLPLLDDPVPDLHHQSFPYKYPHFHSRTFLNSTAVGVEPAICLGTVTVIVNTQLVVPMTCCDDDETEAECDGSVAKATWVNGQSITAVVPPFKAPRTVAVELSSNGWIDGAINPDAQWTRQSYCTPKVGTCVQASAESRCVDSVDCGGVIFKYWGITSSFPVSVSVNGGVSLKLNGNNFLHSETQPAECVFYKDPDGVGRAEFSRSAATPVEDECDFCGPRDEFGVCLFVRLCRAMSCIVPSAPGLLPQAVTVELSFGTGYPITRQNTYLYFFTAATVTSLDVSGGPSKGGTVIGVRGTNFINAPSVLCQFGGQTEFSHSRLKSSSIFFSTTLIYCVVPPCNQQLMVAKDGLSCTTCSFCDVQVQVTMNERDLLPGNPTFSFRPDPKPHGIVPIRGPAGVSITNAVTITGSDFSPLGSGQLPVNGLSCMFGGIKVVGLWHSSCSAVNKTCGIMTCIPPENPLSIAVEVYVAIDGQQYIPVNKLIERVLGIDVVTVLPAFAYYSISRVSPPYVLSSGGASVIIFGEWLDDGQGATCRFQIPNGTVLTTNANGAMVTEISYRYVYQVARSLGFDSVTCTTPALPYGTNNISVSLDNLAYSDSHRDYSRATAEVFVYPPAVVTKVIPTRGYSTGGVRVTVIGSGFWNSPMLQCRFGDLISPTATFYNATMLFCVSLPSNLTVNVDVTFNKQEFSNNSVEFVNYRRPVVNLISPKRIPADTTGFIVISGLYFKSFEMGITCLFVSPSGASFVKGIEWGPGLAQIRCQAPPGPENTFSLVYVSIDGEQYSIAYMPLYHYDLASIVPFTGPKEGGTIITARGYYLGGEVQPMCQFIAQEGLTLVGTVQGTIYSAIAEVRGQGFKDGTFNLTLGTCYEGTEVIYDIKIAAAVGGFVPDGVYSVNVTCNAPCTGSGLIAEYTVKGEVVASTRILNPGSGYSSANPPTVSVRGCDGIGGPGTCGKVTLTAKVGNNCATAGCCSTPVKGTYSVFNSNVTSVIISQGGSGFNRGFPPVLDFSGCDGAGGGSSCRSCQFGTHVSSGTCPSGTCMCSGGTPFCTSAKSAAACVCTAPNEGVECILDTDCTNGGRCSYSSLLAVHVANVVEAPGAYTTDSTSVLCTMPPVATPSSMEGFVQTQGITTYTGMAKTMVRVAVHSAPGYTLKSLLFRYHDPPTIATVTPDVTAARGGSLVTVIGTLFKAQPRLTTLVYASMSEANLVDMQLTCRLHNTLPSQPAIFVNSTMAFCSTNRVCFAGSTQSDCQECIREGCAQPVLGYSHSLASNTMFTPEISMNDQQFARGSAPFYVYSITSFRPFGGVYNGGTHVTIGGLNFDRGGQGPLGCHCRFSRIVVPGTYDSEFRAVKCIAQPLLDVDTVLEVHLGANIEDPTFWTDNRQFFYYYTAFPGGLQVSPDTGSFRGLQPVSLVVPKPMQYNHFRFRSFDFYTMFERVEADVVVNGERDDANGVIGHLVILARLTVRELQKRNPRLEIPEGDVMMGLRTRINNTAFRVHMLIEPTEHSQDTADELKSAILSGTLTKLMHDQYVIKKLPNDLKIGLHSMPHVLADYSEFGSYVRFGTQVQSAAIFNRTQLLGTIPAQPITSSSTVPVFFSVNGQQFSTQPVSFFYYTVRKVEPFGVPFTKRFEPGTTNVNDLAWTMCPTQDNSIACAYEGQGTITRAGNGRATIRVYGNNFRSDLVQVTGDERLYATPMCKFGDVVDDMPGIIGSGLNSDVFSYKQLIVPGKVNYAEGWVECEQPTEVDFLTAYDESNPTRKIRVEVALNGRDFSFSALSPNGDEGLVLYQEPRIYNSADDGMEAWSTLAAPIDGGLTLIFRGEGFVELASTSNPPSCFCIFPVDGSITIAQPWQKVPCTVLSYNEVMCETPLFANQGFGYAASTFREPPRFFKPAMTLNNFHWHVPVIDDFSFFDVRLISPQMSAATFDAGQDRTVTINTGNFLNPAEYFIFCWWPVPGSSLELGFLVEGRKGGDANIFLCDIPDWSTQIVKGKPAINMLPCTTSKIDFTATDATCNLDGSLEMPFGVAFVRSRDTSLLTKKNFAFGKRFTFYATPQFLDFLPKMGDQVGGTEINIYGANFLDLPNLNCKFSEGAQQTLSPDAIYKSSSHLVCITPVVKQQTEVNLYLTFNGVHWMTCPVDSNGLKCTFMHPYYKEQRQCCSWTNSITKETTQVSSFSYAKRPLVTNLEPAAAPTQGDTNIKVLAANMVAGIKGSIFTCEIGGEIVYGKWNTDGGLSYMSCLTRPGMKKGKLGVRVSMNEFEWSINTLPLDVYDPIHVYKVIPSFYIWDDPTTTPITIVGRNFIKPDASVGGLVIRIAEFDANGRAGFKKDTIATGVGPEDIKDIAEPTLKDGDTTDIITFDGRSISRNGCQRFGESFCEAGVSFLYVSMNDGSEWSWEKVPFTFIQRPAVNTECHLGCGILGTPTSTLVNGVAIPGVGVKDTRLPNLSGQIIGPNNNVRGVCEIGTVDKTGQAATTGFCTCSRPDCIRFIDENGNLILKASPGYLDWSKAVGAYDCGNLGGKTEVAPRDEQVELGCSVKAAITEVFPRSGPQVGSTFVQVRGFKFDKRCKNTENPTWCPPQDPMAGYKCKFGTIETPATFNVSTELIECYSPPLQLNGSVEVEISLTGGLEWTESNGYHRFHYYYPPTIMGLEPSVGPATGGTWIKLTAGFTDKLLALGTSFRSLDVNVYNEPICTSSSVDIDCFNMYPFGSYSNWGPSYPGNEGYCVWEPHCRFQLAKQHDLHCDFYSETANYWGIKLMSTDVRYIMPTVIECETPKYPLLLNDSIGLAFDDMVVRLTLNGQLWHTSPVNFRYHAFNNITSLFPRVGPSQGLVWVSLIGTGFVDSHLAGCKFGVSSSLGFEYINENYVRCLAPPSEILQTVPVFVTFNGVQYEKAQIPFEYIAMWSIDKLEPEIGREIGGLIISVRGLNFVESAALACKFGDVVVDGKSVEFESSFYVTCVVPPRILQRPKYVTKQASCDGATIDGTQRQDNGWTVCESITKPGTACKECCDCPQCPECSPNCLCTGDAYLDGNAVCCQKDTLNQPFQNGLLFQQSCPPTGGAMLRGTPRSLCLPPEYRCKWVSIDATTQELECTLLPFSGKVLNPPQPTVLEVQAGEVLHPDLALRLSMPFYVSMDGQTWVSGCVKNPQYNDPLHIPAPCLTNDDSTFERWFGQFTYIERYNVTKVRPEIAPTAGGTFITVIGEGFVQTKDIKCSFGFKSDGFFDPQNPRDPITEELVNVEPNVSPGLFIDSFTIVCVSPPLDQAVNPVIDVPFIIVPLEVSINGRLSEYTKNKIPFAYSDNWEVSKISPSAVPSMGGEYITISGPYFRATEDIMCRFGTCPSDQTTCDGILYATEVEHRNDQTIVCRTPSLNIHQRINVSITLDGQYWSEPTNITEIEFFGVRNVLTFGENEYGQLGFNSVGPRITTAYNCYAGTYKGFDCVNDADCPAGQCLEVTRNLNYWPIFLKQLFAHNVSGVSMGQTHSIIISSETYNDTWYTSPRRGLIYGWGDNLVGQIGIGFAGPSNFNYNLTDPNVLVCPTEEVYLFDRRADERPIVGLPDTWNPTDWIVPTCIVKQDIKSLETGLWEINTFIVYNPFFYSQMEQVASGSFHSLGVTKTGDLYAWGWNTDDQLGQGPVETRAQVAFPILVFYFRRKINVNIVRVAAGFAHSAAVTDSGDLYTWGNNKYGQLGTGDYARRSFPTLVKGFVDSTGATFKVVDIACGLYHCLALTNVGHVWSFGSNSRGQLGTCAGPISRTDNLDLQCRLTPVMNGAEFNTQPYPVKIDFLDITDYNGNIIGQPYVTKVACGAFHSIAIGSPCITALLEYGEPCPQFDLAEGDLYTWGNNRFGQLGSGVASEFTFQATPLIVVSLQTAGTRCRLQENSKTTGCVPPEDFFRMGRRVVNADAGSWHSLAIVEQKEQIGYRRNYVRVNRFYAFGNNEEGQLGLGDTVMRPIPTMLDTNYVKLHDISANYYQSMFSQGCLPNDSNPCLGNGLCFEQGVCKCYPGYRGVDCSIPCDGGALTPCSNHGAPSLARQIAAWRQSVIRATAGWKLAKFLDKLFEEHQCPLALSEIQVGKENPANIRTTYVLVDVGVLGISQYEERMEKHLWYYDKTYCDTRCQQYASLDCGTFPRMNVTSEDILRMLVAINGTTPDGALSTAIRLVIEDWPITLYNQGLRYFKYSYQARNTDLNARTVGPRANGLWWPVDVIPMLEMLQNRSTCWRQYSCKDPLRPCGIIRGAMRTTTGESQFDVAPGCRDGWTARIHFKKRIQEIDQVWSNLEMENFRCDPQAIADRLGIRKVQVQYIWSVFETDPLNISRLLSNFYPDDPLATPLTDPVNQIEAVWRTLNEGCQNATIGQMDRGCLFDGSCICQPGWTGTGCEIECNGGANNPCSGNGICRFDGKCECSRGWTGPACQMECSGARENPFHFPCNLNGMCEGWYTDPRSHYEYGPVDFEQAVYNSKGRGISFYNLSTYMATSGKCTCHYGFRSDWGSTGCSIECPGVPQTYLDEKGECFDNGICNMTGKCECFEGYRNVSCNIECLGGHRREIGTGTVYSNECTSRPVCDVYPNYAVTTIDQRQVLCSEMDPFADDYSKDYSSVPTGVLLRVYNGLCQYMNFDPPLVERQAPVPMCPNDVWCNASLGMAGPGGTCGADLDNSPYCLEYKTRDRNFTGQYYNSSRENPGVIDWPLGEPPDGCPARQCEHMSKYFKLMNYSSKDIKRFGWQGPQPDTAPHRATTVGRCYCLSGYRGEECSKKCPGAVMDPLDLTGFTRFFPVRLDVGNPLWPRDEPGKPYIKGKPVHVDQVREGDPESPLSFAIYGIDVPRGWDTDGDGVLDGVAARSMINICNGRGFCEEDATCSCFLTDRGAHTNWLDVTGYRGEACDTECPGGAHSICSRHGVCSEKGLCTCHKGYRAENCSVQCLGARDCDPQFGCNGVCNYAGACLADGSCQCDPTFKGPGCGKVCPPWTGKFQDECNGRGSCRYDEYLDDAVCDCGIFYEGDACERVAAWVIALFVLVTLILIGVCVHVVRRWLHSRMRQKRRARRDRRKVRRTQAAVGRMKNYKVQMPDAAALEAKGL